MRGDVVELVSEARPSSTTGPALHHATVPPGVYEVLWAAIHRVGGQAPSFAAPRVRCHVLPNARKYTNARDIAFSWGENPDDSVLDVPHRPVLVLRPDGATGKASITVVVEGTGSESHKWTLILRRLAAHEDVLTVNPQQAA